ADRNRSHWSTSKTPSYTKSVSWQHHRINVNHYESQKWLKLAAKQHYKNAERLLAGLPAH
ncbi:hypothetical protein C9183_16715, partial [Escherichia coli]